MLREAKELYRVIQRKDNARSIYNNEDTKDFPFKLIDVATLQWLQKIYLL